MLKRSLITLALLFLAVPAFAEDEPTMHQVYLAAEAGKFNEAQSMMDKVLRDHPNSAKAHFVEAELLAKQGLFSKADVELNNAERLNPDYLLPSRKQCRISRAALLLRQKEQFSQTKRRSRIPAIKAYRLPLKNGCRRYF